MKCFALWINDDGTAQVAELTPEQGEALIAEVEAQPAESAEAAMQMLSDMVEQTSMNEEDVDADVMRGYSKGMPMGGRGKMSPGKVFGDDRGY